MTKSLKTSIFPLFSIAVGGLVGAIIEIPKNIDAGIMSAAAGFVMSSFIMEVSSKVAEPENLKQKLAFLTGMLGGLGLMIGMRVLHDKQISKENDTKFNWSIIIAVCLDVFIDGLMLTKQAETSTGLLIALSLENIIVASAVASKMRRSKISKVQMFGALAAIMGSFLAGSLTGFGISSILTNTGVMFVLGIAQVSLLWVIIEELLPDAKKSQGNTYWIPMIFFLSIGAGMVQDWVVDYINEK